MIRDKNREKIKEKIVRIEWVSRCSLRSAVLGWEFRLLSRESLNLKINILFGSIIDRVKKWCEWFSF